MPCSKLILLLGLWVLFLVPQIARACPSCAEAVPQTSGAEEEDLVRLGRAYNNSIYLMVGMPYFLLGTVGYLIYRHLRVPGAAAPSLPPRHEDQSGLPGDRACSLPSRDGVS
jgi:hypothetical protein